MTEHQLWTLLEGHLTTLHLMVQNRDPAAAKLVKIGQCSAIVRELRHRGEQLPLVPQQPLGATEQAAKAPNGLGPTSLLWSP